jgi:hypothetical protein
MNDDWLAISFYIYYVNPKTDTNRAFERAAHAQEARDRDDAEVGRRTGRDNFKWLAISKAVTKKEDFLSAWNSIAQEVESQKSVVLAAKGHMYTHASGPIEHWIGDDGLEFAGEKGVLTQQDIAGLAKIKWGFYGSLQLYGCNTGVSSLRGWCPAQEFADRQEIRVSGEMGWAYFSRQEDKYEPTEGTDRNIYLHAYRRGKNDPLGDGGSIMMQQCYPPTGPFRQN